MTTHEILCVMCVDLVACGRQIRACLFLNKRHQISLPSSKMLGRLVDSHLEAMLLLATAVCAATAQELSAHG